jgi:hypothetical protein
MGAAMGAAPADITRILPLLVVAILQQKPK